MTQTEREIQELKQALATQIERLDAARQELQPLRERLEKLESQLEKQRDQSSDSKVQIAVLTAGFEEFKKRWDESDRRRWTVYGVFLAAALTFAANLILLVLRK
jgi:predicted  nucleic acid-binding Zn-ribbon protein